MTLLGRDEQISCTMHGCGSKKARVWVAQCAEQDRDLILCLNCAIKLSGILGQDCHELMVELIYEKREIEKTLSELDLEQDRKDRLRDLRDNS